MRTNQVLGLIFSNTHDNALRDFTAERALGSVPFGGRYRLIDFPLSNMVYAGIGKVGVVTKRNYQSLMDHIGSGKEWGLSRKNDGLYFLAPYDVPESLYDGRVAALNSLAYFFNTCNEEYVVMCDCHVVGSISYRALVQAHIDTGADITVGYARGVCPTLPDNMLLSFGADSRIDGMRLGTHPEGEHCYGLGIYVLRLKLLRELITEAAACNQMYFERDILQGNLQTLNIHGYEVPEYTRVISSPDSYFAASMELLDESVREKLFPHRRPVYTKVRDCSPAVYGLHADTCCSLVADGSRVEGTVRNSILFRDVQIEKGAVVENCVVMQGSVVHSGAAINHVILDKNVHMSEGRILRGFEGYPIYVGKGRKL